MQTEDPDMTQRNQERNLFRDAAYGLFIHFGLYAIPGGIWQGRRAPHGSEWIMRNLEIPLADVNWRILQAYIDEKARSGRVDGFIILYSRKNDIVIDYLCEQGLLYVIVGLPSSLKSVAELMSAYLSIFVSVYDFEPVQLTDAE